MGALNGLVRASCVNEVGYMVVSCLLAELCRNEQKVSCALTVLGRAN